MSIVLDGTSGLTSPAAVLTTTPLPVTSGGTGVATSTGSGANVLGTSPTLVTPLLGTPTSGNLANCTGIPAPAALSTASGSAPSYSCRAWVNFIGTGTVTINASGNVSSITDNGVGDYTVNFTTALSDAKYAVVVGGTDYASANVSTSGIHSTAPLTTTTTRIHTNQQTNSNSDLDLVCVAIFR